MCQIKMMVSAPGRAVGREAAVFSLQAFKYSVNHMTMKLALHLVHQASVCFGVLRQFPM